MVVDIGNLWYFFEILIVAVCITGFGFFLNGKSDEKKLLYIRILAWAGFAIHFLKQLVYWDVSRLSSSTAENICAISTLVVPLCLQFGKKDFFFNDSVFFLSIFGGLAGVLVPTTVMFYEAPIYSFECIRFYFCHGSLFAIPLLLGIFGLYRPSLRSFWTVPLGFLAYQMILMANTALLSFTGLFSVPGYEPWQLFIDSQYLNNSFTFGPTPDTGFLTVLFDALIPSFMKYQAPYDPNKTLYWPVVCLSLPALLTIPLYLIVAFPFSAKSLFMKRPKKATV